MCSKGWVKASEPLLLPSAGVPLDAWDVNPLRIVNNDPEPGICWNTWVEGIEQQRSEKDSSSSDESEDDCLAQGSPPLPSPQQPLVTMRPISLLQPLTSRITRFVGTVKGKFLQSCEIIRTLFLLNNVYFLFFIYFVILKHLFILTSQHLIFHKI